MNLTRSLVCLAAIQCLSAFGQETGKLEPADIHASPPTIDYHKRTMGGSFLFAGQLDLRRATMLNLIGIAWGVDAGKVLGGPSWLDFDRFDLRAKVPAGTTQQTMRPLLQALLAERFGLAVHKDTRQVAGWALTAGKNLQIRKSEAPGDPQCHADFQGGTSSFTLACTNMPMAEVALRLGDLPGGYIDEGVNVVDRTGLTGGWNFTLKFTPRGGVGGPTLFEAVEQMGMRLEPATVPIEAIVVDRVNRTPTANGPDVTTAFPPAPTEFEVTVVKPSPPGAVMPGYVAGGDTRIQYLPGGRVNAQGNLLGVVRWVWGLNAGMIFGLPPFATSDSWDIQGKAPGDVGDSDTLTEMLKDLLVTRFKLAYHKEERPLMAPTLVAVKPKLKRAEPEERTGCKEGPAAPTRNDPRDANPLLSRLLTCRNVTMGQFAYLLYRGMASGYVPGPVTDATGLEGGWDFTLNFSAPGQIPKTEDGAAGGAAAVGEPSGTMTLQEAMERQIGIRMEMQKRPAEVLVIDHLERTPGDN